MWGGEAEMLLPPRPNIMKIYLEIAKEIIKCSVENRNWKYTDAVVVKSSVNGR